MKEFNIFNAKTHLSAIVQDALDSGESFVISRYNKPVLRCIPILPKKPLLEDDKEKLKELSSLLNKLSSKKRKFKRREMGKEKRLVEKAEQMFFNSLAELEQGKSFWSNFREKFEELTEVDEKTDQDLERVSEAIWQIKIMYKLGIYVARLATVYSEALGESVTKEEIARTLLS